MTGPLLPIPPDLAADFESFRAALASAPDSVRALLERSGAPEAWTEYGLLLHAKSAELALIGKGDRPHVFTRHILDSLNPLSVFPEPPKAALDVGSGGGLPGIPLAIAWPGTRVVLLESRERKAGFLEQAVRALRLPNVRIVCARLEDYGKTWREAPCDAVFIRALDLGDALDHAHRACESNAAWIYFLGARAPEEALRGMAHAAGATVALGVFGGRLLTGRFFDR